MLQILKTDLSGFRVNVVVSIDSDAELSAAAQRGEAFEMMVGVTKQGADHGQPLEVVAYPKLFGHTHATVQLHGVFADERAGLADQASLPSYVWSSLWHFPKRSTRPSFLDASWMDYL